MKRFYKDVATGPALTGDGFAILLDGRPVRTPGKEPMVAPTKALADAIAAEWAAQDDAIKTDTMPLTQLLTTRIDRTANRADIEAELFKYLDSDLLCYRAESLADEQEALWGPWLLWFKEKYGHTLETTFGLTRLDQPQAAHDAMRKTVRAMDIDVFTAFQIASAITGSIVLGLALAEGALSPDEAWKATLCEELHYERTHDLEKHGLDPIEEKRRKGLRRDLEACAAYIKLVKSTTI